MMWLILMKFWDSLFTYKDWHVWATIKGNILFCYSHRCKCTTWPHVGSNVKQYPPILHDVGGIWARPALFGLGADRHFHSDKKNDQGPDMVTCHIFVFTEVKVIYWKFQRTKQPWRNYKEHWLGYWTEGKYVVQTTYVVETLKLPLDRDLDVRDSSTSLWVKI